MWLPLILVIMFWISQFNELRVPNAPPPMRGYGRTLISGVWVPGMLAGNPICCAMPSSAPTVTNVNNCRLTPILKSLSSVGENVCVSEKTALRLV